MTYEIEEKVPMPKPRLGGAKYPWGEMKVGDSFFVAVENEQPSTVQGTVAGSARAYGKKHGNKFTTRIIDGGVRVWRIS